jgi:nucleotide-binding universal stress UspA family protein
MKADRIRPVKKESFMATNRRILIAADASDASRRAVTYVIETIAGNAGFHVGLVHFELPPRMLEWGGSEDAEIEDRVSEQRASAYHEMEQEAIEKGRTLLQSMREKLAERGIDVTTLLVRFDEPLDPKHLARDILTTAKERDFGTVVVGRHTFSGLKRFFQHHAVEELIRTGQGITIWVVE